ncbi:MULTISPECIES: hypothetical protein [Tatumella]|uniref:Uncharacterized protein n=1 Tax=Tatumella punctata TaxID=399969 RepID=A0ABW1VQZ4_9GAMM|nr:MULTISPECIES: hypothetical protein [unclassified Tatumella]MBS0856683.1 hypothetical protein [Tatumella sp. JGM16]MBS0878022.1 hypothetical protein [Tatumella sp. JGM82]MBS0891255.1 hypothetical protein [Tatumella sp. JGM94]MBS0895148.1 hypothetical protein [Tatumella sp. JGM130]MBS0902634.1 hypothetical protein [Tatumella sp. JGM100]
MKTGRILTAAGRVVKAILVLPALSAEYFSARLAGIADTGNGEGTQPL